MDPLEPFMNPFMEPLDPFLEPLDPLEPLAPFFAFRKAGIFLSSQEHLTICVM